MTNEQQSAAAEARRAAIEAYNAAVRQEYREALAMKDAA